MMALPAPKDANYCSIIVDDDSCVYYSHMTTNTLIMRTRKVSGMNHFALWSIGSPELFNGFHPGIEHFTAWTNNSEGFVALGAHRTHPLPWFNVRAIEQVKWSSVRFRNGTYSNRLLCVKLKFAKLRITRWIKFTTTIYEERLEALLNQTVRLFKFVHSDCGCNLAFADRYAPPALPRGNRYDLWSQYQRVHKLITRELETEYRYDSQHSYARASSEHWTLLLNRPSKDVTVEA